MLASKGLPVQSEDDQRFNNRINCFFYCLVLLPCLYRIVFAPSVVILDLTVMSNSSEWFDIGSEG